MIVGRAIIPNIKEARKKIEQLGAIFKGEYIYKDIIFIPDKNNFNLSDDYLKLRVYTENNWPTKNFRLVRKIRGKSVLKQEFDSEKASLKFINDEFSAEFKRGFEFSRTGWQYDLKNNHIFVEDVENFKPTIEIESESEPELKSLFDQIGIVEKLTESMPEIMKRIKIV
ncbi:MAG TPA: hypothetical protein VMC41_01890 [Candidatus Nanoarchaeia archaeon]|nr:hypothetical protein [Candidatus Nanoarchaeia archaeon]